MSLLRESFELYPKLLKFIAVQTSAITFQTNCELNTIHMLLTVEIQYSVSIKSKQILKGGMTYV